METDPAQEIKGLLNELRSRTSKSLLEARLHHALRKCLHRDAESIASSDQVQQRMCNDGSQKADLRVTPLRTRRKRRLQTAVRCVLLPHYMIVVELSFP